MTTTVVEAVQAGPTGRVEADALTGRVEADALAGRICVAAAEAARSECALLELIGEFDASGALRWWTDVKSMAHWLSWACSMAPGTAREHVRVARALRRMPTVLDAFRDGRLSYSKVREVTRVVGQLDEARLCRLALTATAAQLARTIAGYRAADGTRLDQEPRRRARWRVRDDGMVDFGVRLPADEAAVLLAALTMAEDQNGTPPPGRAPSCAEPAADPTIGPDGEPVPTAPDEQRRYTRVDALLDLARSYTHTAPEDRSGEDRHLVVVHVNADQLAGDVPAGTRDTQDSGNVPAGTSEPTCYVEGAGPVEPETARRHACDADLVGAVVDRHGEVLALGRRRRLVSPSQRRALMIRDRMCRYPGCHQTRHLDAHHVVPWAAGGPTDLDNLVLLCRWHHTAVHEGGMTLTRCSEPDGRHHWQARHADGTPVRAWQGEATLTARLRATHPATSGPGQRVGFHSPEARTIRPGWRGEPFDLHACVETLFGMRLDPPTPRPDDLARAA